MLRYFALATALFFSLALVAQDDAPQNWWNLDLTADKYPGVSADKAQEYLKGKTGRQVVVAVIDSGVDIMHEDLKDIIWTNEGEIAGNGIDDDNNGYVDDIHGWNFIGGANGTHVNYENLEVVRIYNRLAKKYANRNVDGLPKKERQEYAKMLEMKEEIDKEYDAAAPQYAVVAPAWEAAQKAVKTIGKDAKDISMEEIKALEGEDFTMLKQILPNLSRSGEFPEAYENLEGYTDYLKGTVEYNYNVDYDARDIVGDDPSNLNDRNYGNNDVKGPDSGHGTHVSGIIAAVRDNNIGVDGVGGANIRIMSVRTVPNGDERDKDVANAIRYAVDNGAQVVNMSFGKGYSPYKGAVDAAVKYAQKNDVLLVHAAGNDGKKLTLTNNYPNDVFQKKSGKPGKKAAKNWIEVGAASKMYDAGLPAGFSNYNKEYVDVFAPGADIYSTTPENNYASFNGTSMAAPMVAGIAALVRSYFPDLTARQVREIILESAIPADLSVNTPGEDDKQVKFDRLSATGAVANAYAAVKMAEMTKGKKKKAAQRDASLMKY
ncbi:peptidase S8 [Lewinellaceae bacterium SD302]|nr:peptidase S8 [Lewinellaceae bacterium SD302]